jgi:hypothetical protein
VPASARRAPRATVLPKPDEVGPPAEPAGAPPREPERRSLFRREVSQAQAKSERPKAAAKAESASWPWIDVVAASLVAVAAAFTSSAMPASGLRMVFGLAMLLFVPGYLLLQAFAVPVPSGRDRLWQALASLGISPAVVGLLALMTSIVQGGFRLGVIVVLVTLACLGFGVAALVRRRALAHAALDPAASVQPSAAAATAKSGPIRP